MNMCDCPKYQHCSAPICPLDPGIMERAYLPGESICFFMHEFVKPGSHERFKVSHSEEIYEAIQTVLPRMLSRHGYIKNRLERASGTSSRMDRRVGDLKKREVA